MQDEKVISELLENGRYDEDQGTWVLEDGTPVYDNNGHPILTPEDYPNCPACQRELES